MDFSRVAAELRDYPADGSLQLMDVLGLSEPSRTFLSWVIRQGRVSVPACQEFTQLKASAAQEMIRVLVAREFLVVHQGDDSEPYYQVRMVSRARGKSILDDW